MRVALAIFSMIGFGDLRPHRHRLQQLPQPALPQVSGRCGTRVAGRARGRSPAGAVLSCGVHAAGAIADIAYQNKAVIYDLLFKASAETTLTIAADPKHLGARIGFIRCCTPGAPR